MALTIECQKIKMIDCDEFSIHTVSFLFIYELMFSKEHRFAYAFVINIDQINFLFFQSSR